MSLQLLRSLWPFLICVSLLAGCSTAGPAAETTALTSPLPSNTPLPNASPTSNPTALPASTATATPTITLSPVPTATSTPELPVRAGTPMPVPGEIITLANAPQLRELGRFGSARLLETFLSADGSLQFAATGAGVYVYEPGGSEPLALIEVYPRDNYSNQNFSTSADGSRLLVIAQEDIKLFSSTGEPLGSFDRPPGDYRFATAGLSPDGSLAVIAGCEDYHWKCSFQVLKVDDGSQLLSGDGEAALFSPAGDLLAVEFDRKLWLYATTGWSQSGRLWKEVEWGKTFSPNGALLALARPNQVELWSTTDQKLLRVISGFAPGEYSPPRLTFSPDSKLLALLDETGDFTVWELASGERLARQPSKADYYDLFLVADSGEVRILPTPMVPVSGVEFVEWQPLGMLPGNQGLVQASFRPNPDEQSMGSSLCKLDFKGSAHCLEADWPLVVAQDGEVYGLVPGLDPGIYDLRRARLEAGVWELDGQWLVQIRSDQTPVPVFLDVQTGLFAWYEFTWGTPSGQRSTLWDLSTQTRLRQWYGGTIDRIQFSGDRRLAAFLITNYAGNRSSGRELSVIDLAARKPFYTKQLPAAINTNLLLLPAGEALLHYEGKYGPYHNSLQLATVKMPGGKIIPLGKIEYPLEQDSASDAAVSPDGGLLALGMGSGLVKLVDLASGLEIYTWQAHTDSIRFLNFSPDGALLVTQGADGFGRVWGIWP